MTVAQIFLDLKKRRRWLRFALSYWLAWAVLFAGLAWGVHRYFEYRTRELDKRLERLR